MSLVVSEYGLWHIYKKAHALQFVTLHDVNMAYMPETLEKGICHSDIEVNVEEIRYFNIRMCNRSNLDFANCRECFMFEQVSGEVNLRACVREMTGSNITLATYYTNRFFLVFFTLFKLMLLRSPGRRAHYPPPKHFPTHHS